jgi:hypothetical protein
MSSLAPPRWAGARPGIQTAPAWASGLRQARPGRLTLLLLLLLVATPALYLANTSGALTTGYNIQKLQAERRSWQLRNQQLELELAKARSLAWVEAEAVARLGMQRPGPQTIIRVDVPRPGPSVAPAAVAGAARTDSAAGSRARVDPSAALPAHSETWAAAASWLEGVGAFLARLLLGR